MSSVDDAFSTACPSALADAWLAPGFCAYELPVSIGRPRSVVAVGSSTLLALERDTASVVVLQDTDNDGLPDTKRTVASAPGLNHGLALHDSYLYASSDTIVYRWAVDTIDWSIIGSGGELVIFNMNADGNGGAPMGHTTRTLVVDDQDGMLYVSVGSDQNVDPNSFRSRIRRFDIRTGLLPIDFLTGEVFADGLRNSVGLAFDVHGVLWGVENGADNLYRSDLGGDIHNDNPAEELNRFREEDAGKHWGYPYCWTEFNLPGLNTAGRGTAWAWPSFMNGTITDEWCRTTKEPSVMAMQAHSAPLGIAFYQWKPQSELPPDCPANSAFPAEMDGYAFIAFHGSWNRDIPTGYKVVYVEMDQEGNAIGNQPLDLLKHDSQNNNAKWSDGFRPVDVDFDECGRLVVSSDGTRGRGSKMVRLEAIETGTSRPFEIKTQPPNRDRGCRGRGGDEGVGGSSAQQSRDCAGGSGDV